MIQLQKSREHFLFCNLLAVGFMQCRCCGARLTNQLRSQILPTVSGEYLSINFVVNFLQHGHKAKPMNIPFTFRKWWDAGLHV